jgi:recombination associated protein RdgC
MTFVIETRTVAKEALEKKLAAAIEAFKQQEGREPGKKQTRELRADVRQSLLPNVFPKTEKIAVWIDPAARTVGVGATAQCKTDEVVSGLVRAIDGFAVERLVEEKAITVAMRDWLLQDPDLSLPHGISLGSECMLKATDESKAVAHFNKQSLVCDEVRQSLKAGKVPMRVEIAFDQRVAVLLCASGALKKIRLEEAEIAPERSEQGDDLDGSFTLFAMEMAKTLVSLQAAVEGTASSVRLAEAAAQNAMQGIAGMWQREEETASEMAEA